jgi:2-polyprenyl-3-methyl-5-hydroxy-6-metoxy-1,4-benzoquinol methylase
LRFLAERDRQPELMDQPGLDAEIHQHALRALGFTNTVSGTSRQVWRGIAAANILPPDGQPLRILDIAAGGGDVLIGVIKLAARHKIAIEAHWCDINPTAVAYAEQTAVNAGITNAKFSQLDVLSDPIPQGYDVVMCTLFLHHLSDDNIRHVLRRMAQAAAKCVVVDDLCRNRLGYLYAWAGGRLLTRSRIVHTDGPLSVRAAFTIGEIRQLAHDAGLDGAQFHRHWPQRFLMTWKKS